MGLIRRDKIDDFPLFATKDHTDLVADLLEALCGATSVPVGLARMVVTRNSAILDLSGLMRLIGALNPIPLSGYDASGGGTTAKIGLVPGSFGANAEATPGVSVPTIGGTRIDAATPPKLTLGASDVQVYLEVAVNTDGKITAVTVKSTSSATLPANSTSTLHVPLFHVAINFATGTGIASVQCGPGLRGSQTYELCGGTDHLWALS